MSKTIQIFLLATAMIVLSGCFPVGTRIEEARPGVPPGATVPSLEPTEKVAEMVTQTPTPWETPTTRPTATAYVEDVKPTPTAITLAGMGVDTLSFTDTYVGFSFDYPANWTLNAVDASIAQNSVGYTHSVRSPWPTVGPKQQEGFPPGTAGIDVTIINDGTKTLEQAIAERETAFKTDEFPPTVLSKEKWVLPSGLNAVVFMLDTRMGTVANMVTVIGGREVLVTGMGDLALYDAIARSLRPIE